MSGDSVTITCVECSTGGKVDVSLTGFSISEITEVAAFKKVKPQLQVDLSGFTAHIDLDVELAATKTFVKTLFYTETPLGIGFDTTIVTAEVGALIAIDLVFSVDANIDLEGGYEVDIPSAAATIDLFGGKVTNTSL
jgi:hypothetical protein